MTIKFCGIKIELTTLKGRVRAEYQKTASRVSAAMVYRAERPNERLTVVWDTVARWVS